MADAPMVKNALTAILGNMRLAALIHSGVSESYILRTAAVEAFKSDRRDMHTDVIRDALNVATSKPHSFLVEPDPHAITE